MVATAIAACCAEVSVPFVSCASVIAIPFGSKVPTDPPMLSVTLLPVILAVALLPTLPAAGCRAETSIASTSCCAVQLAPDVRVAASGVPATTV